MSMSYFHTVSISTSYFFLGACFAKSALNSNDLFQDLSQGCQFKGSDLGPLVIESSLGSSVIWSSLGPKSSVCLTSFKKNCLKFDIFS